MDPSIASARGRIRKTISVVQAVFSWWVVAPVVFVAAAVALLQDKVSAFEAIAAATFWALTLGLGAALARMASRFCSNCGAKLSDANSG